MHRTAWSSDEPEPADRLAMLPSFWRNAISRNPLKFQWAKVAGVAETAGTRCRDGEEPER